MAKPSVEVVESVASIVAADPKELEAVLYRTIDPQALNRLFDGRGDTDGFVQFAFAGCRVTVEADGDVFVTERDGP
jgi:hypothetical protein